MGFRGVSVIVCVVFIISYVFCSPRDAGFGNQNERYMGNVVQPSKDLTPPPTHTGVSIPGRIPCLYEEATEDTVCQEHCLPKGYSYGICVSKTCSCI